MYCIFVPVMQGTYNQQCLLHSTKDPGPRTPAVTLVQALSRLNYCHYGTRDVHWLAIGHSKLVQQIFMQAGRS